MKAALAAISAEFTASIVSTDFPSMGRVCHFNRKSNAVIRQFRARLDVLNIRIKGSKLWANINRTVDEGKEAATMSDALKAFKEVEGSEYSPQWTRKGAKALLIIKMSGEREVVAHMMTGSITFTGQQFSEVVQEAIKTKFNELQEGVICDK